MIDYDDRARRWLAGELEPSIGREAWNRNAAAEARIVHDLLRPYDVHTLLEVGSGFGRLTPHLAEHFDRVIAVDSSPAMVECTLLACPDDTCNVTVADHYEFKPYPVADAAVVWDVIDADWSIEQADALLAAVLRSCLIVLVAQSRLDGWEPRAGQVMREGSAWWLLQAATL